MPDRHLQSPLASVGIIGLGPGVNDSVPAYAREGAESTVGDDATPKIAVVAVEHNVIADLGTIAGLDEAGSFPFGRTSLVGHARPPDRA